MSQNRLLIAAVLSAFCAIGIAGEELTDSRDGKRYRTVEIGSQTWMAENLNYEADGSKCYENNSANCEKYGRLYNWETAKKACPSGWHLPSRSEYEALDKAVGGEGEAGKKLKAKSGWNNNGNGTDDFGFSALPGGDSYSDSGFYGIGNSGSWWSSSDGKSIYAYNRYIYYNFSDVTKYSGTKSYLLSVRCIRNN